MFVYGDNPIAQVGTRCVNGVITNAISVPIPSTYECAIEDVSNDGAKRTEDTVMQKKMIGQAIAITLAWKYISIQKCSQILRMFNHEYIFVKFLDPTIGDYKILEFYVGNRTVPLYNSKLGKWSNLGFKIIQRDARK